MQKNGNFHEKGLQKASQNLPNPSKSRLGRGLGGGSGPVLFGPLFLFPKKLIFSDFGAILGSILEAILEKKPFF